MKPFVLLIAFVAICFAVTASADAQCPTCRGGGSYHFTMPVMPVPAPMAQRFNPYYIDGGGTLWVPRRVGVFGWQRRWYPIPRPAFSNPNPQAGVRSAAVYR